MRTAFPGLYLPVFREQEVFQVNDSDPIFIPHIQNVCGHHIFGIVIWDIHEIPNFPVPTYDPNDRPINEEDHRLKGYFDDSYRVIDVG